MRTPVVSASASSSSRWHSTGSARVRTSSGEEALAAVLRETPDVVVADVHALLGEQVADGAGAGTPVDKAAIAQLQARYGLDKPLLDIER